MAKEFNCSVNPMFEKIFTNQTHFRSFTQTAGYAGAQVNELVA